MLTSEFDYHLPEELIAQTPLEQRDQSNLLVLNKATGDIQICKFFDFPKFLTSADLLVMNNTRVSARRLIGEKQTGAKIELLILKKVGTDHYETLVKPGKKFLPGTSVLLENGLCAQAVEQTSFGGRIVRISGEENVEEILAASGEIPLPPYIHSLLADEERYQTIFSHELGSAAAPTAGLHFTDKVLDDIKARGAEIAFVTLDVGLDTFRPVKAEKLEDHVMHGERYSIPSETKQAIEKCPGRIFAVGTTSVRTLETAAYEKRKLNEGEGVSKLFITPGYEFKVVDAMLTNFHMPRTSMLSMVSAMCGKENMFAAYERAINEKFRFLSFGDSMLIV